MIRDELSVLAAFPAEQVARHLASGARVRVREDWCSPFRGFFLYYPSRCHQPTALAAVARTLQLQARAGQAHGRPRQRARSSWMSRRCDLEENTSQRAERLQKLLNLILGFLALLNAVGVSAVVTGLADWTVTIAMVANFRGDDANEDRVTGFLLEDLRAAARRFKDLEVVSLGRAITVQEGEDSARSIGASRHAAVVLWGWYTTKGEPLIMAHFEAIRKPRNLVLLNDRERLTGSLSDLDSHAIQVRLSADLTYLTFLTVGLAKYESDDLPAAVSLFSEAVRAGSAMRRASIRAGRSSAMARGRWSSSQPGNRYSSGSVDTTLAVHFTACQRTARRCGVGCRPRLVGRTEGRGSPPPPCVSPA